MQKRAMVKKCVSVCIWIILIPAIILLETLVFGGKQYALISLTVTVLSLLPFFLSFERKEQSIPKMVLIAALTAISVMGRMLFYALPGFKPVTAIVIITGIYFGAESGFMVGALSAVISNFAFGQGPWTPFQMLTWGLIGLIAGFLSAQLKKSKVCLYGYGVLSGVAFSMIMDVWSVLWQDGVFNPSRYIGYLLSSTGYMIIYAVSNVVFLFLLANPIGAKLERVKDKYGI